MNGRTDTLKGALPEIVYEPYQRTSLGFLAVLRLMAGSTWKKRHLIIQLLRRDFLGSYRKSLLGPTWVFLSPVIGILAWVFLRRAGMLNTGEVSVPYPVYILVGTTMWGLFMGFYSAAASTLRAAGSLLLQINFPHEVYFGQQVGLQLINFAILFVLNILVMLYFGVAPSWKTIFLPVILLPLFLTGSAIGLIISAFSAVTLDLRRGLDLVLGLLIWLSPIIYTDNAGSLTLRTISQYNPLTYLVCSPRDLVLYGHLYNAPAFALCALLSLVLFLYACRVFYVIETRLVERTLA